MCVPVAMWLMFQSTPPRGRRQLFLLAFSRKNVSIHASTREATTTV